MPALLFFVCLPQMVGHGPENDVKSKYPEEYSTADKVDIEKKLARKSCFV